MNKTQLLKQIRTGYRLFKVMLAGLDEAQMLSPGVIGVWSVKDILAHITVHEQRLISWMEERLQGIIPAAPQPYDMPEDELAVLNQQIYLENRTRPLSEVLAGLDEAHAQTLALVEAAAEEDLLDPNRFCLRGGEPLWEAVAANTFWHYEEHTRDIQDGLAAHPTDPG